MKRLPILLALVGCGEVVKVTDSGPADSPAAIDAPAVIDAPMIDAAPDRFPDGMFSFEEVPQGHPTTPYTATSGVILSKPNPNPTDSTGMFIVDCNMNSGAFGFGCDPQRVSIPNGLKFLVLANLGSQGRIIEFSFPKPVGSFSLAVTNTNGMAGQTYALAALTPSGADLTVAQVQTVPIASWAGNRVSVSHPDGFTRVVLRNVGAVMNAVAIDAIRWTSN